MPTVMVIGASRGIGLELAGARHHPHAGPAGRAGGPQWGGGVHALDVRHAPQIAALAQAVARGGIDVLIHDAGVAGHGMAPEEVRRINTEAPIRVAQALLSAVARSREKKTRARKPRGQSRPGSMERRRRAEGKRRRSRGRPHNLKPERVIKAFERAGWEN